MNKRSGEDSNPATSPAVAGGFTYGSLVNKKVLIPVAILMAALISSGILWYFTARNDGKSIQYDKNSVEYSYLLSVKNEPIPPDDEGKSRYYSHLATAYSDLKDYKNALDSSLKADSFMSDEQRKNGRSVYLSVAHYYEQLGDRAKAREYYQREIDLMKQDEHSDDTKANIDLLETKKRALL